MRREQFGIGTFAHIIQRGAHRMPIIRDGADQWRFLRLLRYVNDENVPRHWERDVSPEHIRHNFYRPDHWPDANPYVSIIAFCLMDNHFHLLVQEQIEGGISKFIQRISKSMVSHYNLKYQESGTLFEGRYRARVITNDRHLQYLGAYINIKNPFERFPGGLRAATADFERAYSFATAYPFSSTADFCGIRMSSILDHDLRRELFASPEEFKEAARELMEGRQELAGEEDELCLEPWGCSTSLSNPGMDNLSLD